MSAPVVKWRKMAVPQPYEDESSIARNRGSIRWRPATSPSERVIWRTPAALYRALDKEFSFTIDVAADAENALVDRFVERETDALKISWAGERVFCNPPYGRELERWPAKAVLESQEKARLSSQCYQRAPATGGFTDMCCRTPRSGSSVGA